MMSTTIKRLLAAAVVSSGALIVPEAPVLAQGGFAAPTGGMPVATRPRPDYDPVGIRAGAFLLYPTLDQEFGYDSNVFESEIEDQGGDFFYTIAPSLNLVSNWSRHSLTGTVRTESQFYFAEKEENTTGINADVAGRLDIGGQSSLTTTASYIRDQEGRGAPGTLAAADEPTAYRELSGGATFASRINRVSYSVGADYSTREYDDSDLVGGGVQPNGDRDVNRIDVTGEVGYDFSPGYIGFVRANYNTRDFNVESDRSGVDRDSDGYDISTGVQFQLTNVIVGEASVGYFEQQYADDPTLDDANGITFGADLEWYPSPLLTGRVTASREVGDTVVGGSSGTINTNAGLGVDYEFRRNIIVTTDVGYGNSEFEGIQRNDDTYSGSLETTYLINRNARAGFRWEVVNRKSNVEAENYMQHIVGLNLTLQM